MNFYGYDQNITDYRSCTRSRWNFE